MNTSFPSASLYVGDLNPEVVESMLFELFNPVGTVASIRVCRDAVTRRSLGYAYVNFHNVVDAERALDTMNYHVIQGRPCRIMWSHRDPSIRKSGVGNVFIKNLDKTIDHKSLYDTFSAFGNILSCKVQTDAKGESLGYGFVHYEKQEEAENAIQKVNGMLLKGKQVFVGFFKPKKEREATNGEAKFTNIYVKGLPASVDEEKLTSVFEEVGPVKNAIIMRDAEKKSKGFGFVNFQNSEDAKKVLEEFEDTEIDGSKIQCFRAQKRVEREKELKKKFEALKLEKLNKYQGVNLYVKNLDDKVTEDQLREEFRSFGDITSAKVMRDDKGASKGFGFVCFTTPEEATKAVTEMNGRMIESKPIYVALAQRKEVRRAQLEAQHARRGGVMVPPQGGAMGYMPSGQQIYYQNMQAQRGGFMFPQQRAMVTGPRWNHAGGQSGQRGYPTYMMPAAQGQGGRVGGRGRGRGAQNGQGRGGQRGAFKNVAGQMVPAQPVPGDLASLLSQAPVDQQKQILGEKLYPLIHKLEPDQAGKITGMLLEMDNGELLILLDSPEELAEKVQEAVAVLQDHAAKEGKTEM